MAYIANTAFEVYASNISRDNLQNITGKFGTGTVGSFTEDDCSAGFLCVRNGRLPLEGYSDASLNNGNSWYMNAAATGASPAGFTASRNTGIYACNSYDVNQASDGALNFNFPGRTLGIKTPKGERGTFTEIMIGEQYNFGAGNFSTAPTGSNLYCTIANGLLVAQAAAPTDGSVYFQVMDMTKRFTEGPYDGGAKYTLMALRSVAATE